MSQHTAQIIWGITIFLILLGGLAMYYRDRLRKLEQRVKKLEILSAASIELIEKQSHLSDLHMIALKRLTDPEAIMEDMEKSARMKEMRDANRTTLPREDAGPPARVYSPGLRAKVPRGNYKRLEK